MGCDCTNDPESNSHIPPHDLFLFDSVKMPALRELHLKFATDEVFQYCLDVRLIGKKKVRVTVRV